MDAFGTPYIITTRNLDTLGTWMVETLATIKPTGEAPARMLVWPQFTFTPDSGPNGIPDWICDTRVLGKPGTILRPLDAVEYLRASVERAEELAALPPRTEAGPCYGASCDHVSHRRSM